MKPLKPNAMDFSNFVRMHMSANVPPGTTLEDVLEPTYWANHANRLKRGAIIEILSEDSVLDCELRVLEVGPTFARVRLLRNFIAEEAPKKRNPAPVEEDVEVTYGGKQDRWRVVHRGHVVRSGFETIVEANKAAEEYRGKLAA